MLWYQQPATEWTEALPVGNGRLRAMVFGRPGRERVQLNEETMWAGHPVDRDREGTARYIDDAVTIRTPEGQPVDVRHPEPGVTVFDTTVGSTYVITPKDRLR